MGLEPRSKKAVDAGKVFRHTVWNDWPIRNTTMFSKTTGTKKGTTTKRVAASLSFCLGQS